MSAIINKQNAFYLLTKNTSYIFSILPTGHLRHIHYGAYIDSKSIGLNEMAEENNMWSSWNAVYDDTNNLLQMSNTMLEYSLPGKGDNRVPSAIIRHKNGSTVLDMVFKDYSIVTTTPKSNLPSPLDTSDSETLIITLQDKVVDIRIRLYYTVYPSDDVIVRSTELINNTEDTIYIEKLASLVLDTEDDDWEAITLDGAWGHEKTQTRSTLYQGSKRIESRTGFSSNQHDPLVILARKDCSYFNGEAIATTLMYSGNHCETIEKTPFNHIRVENGINSENFYWPLSSGDCFRTPNAILTYSTNGLNDISKKLSTFAIQNVMKSKWKLTPRPILINNWEATYYKYDETKIHDLIDKAADLGFELFVLDDGWFGKRNNNKTSLGDWYCNKSKIPSGIKGLSDYTHQKGLKFGLWFEPEMLNMDSDLYRTHPDWIVKCPNREPSPAKNEFILDLTRQEIRDYILCAISTVIEEGVDYIKWDMNRDMSDMYSPYLPDQGMFFHSYILGLYDLLEKFTSKFPNLIIEMCANGGDRIDWGILPYATQFWISDVSDARDRIPIQEGAMLTYPRSMISAHVSEVPNHQTLRMTDIETRFDVASMGILGYELDITRISNLDEEKIRNQIEFYKGNRELFQYGHFYKLENHNSNIESWAIGTNDRYVVVTFQHRNIGNLGRHELLRLPFIDKKKNWTITERVKTDEEYWTITTSGEILANHGIYLPAKFSGRMINGRTRKLGDNSSSMYIIEKV